MAPKEEPTELESGVVSSPAPAAGGMGQAAAMAGMVAAVVIVVQLAILIGLTARDDSTDVVIEGLTTNTADVGGDVAVPVDTTTDEVVLSNVPDNNFFDIETIFAAGENQCAGKKPDWPNLDCVHVEGPQSGANVTKGYKGTFEVDHEPIMDEYWERQMCAVNVHWHLGTEHYSVGEYDELGTGPNGNGYGPDGIIGDGVQPGYRCRHYDEYDPKFTTPYEWKHCKEMEVGETYEVHWPHSAAGACGTVDQYQTPFYDGVFCRDGVLTSPPAQVGVQGQIFVVVNDEEYFYPDLIRGWIKDGDYGMDIHRYTGSTTGASRSNEICSAYTPITWQVDRKCHMISASSFDKLCYDMKLQRDDMKDDLHAHGSRELVADHLVANNGVRRTLREKDTYAYAHRHAHDHDHDHEHDHHHHEWY